jgi:NAD-dependent dihydropyrimidine dehydrogenase PreA subunit
LFARSHDTPTETVAMSRARLNYGVDAAIAVAFLITAVTGILFLLPATWVKVLGLGMPGMLGLSFHTWRWLHDWSGVVATAGIVAHFALHWRWVVSMTRRTFGAETRERRPGAARSARTSAIPAEAGPRSYSAYSAESAAKDDEPRYTRRGVVAGAVAVAATVLVSAGLLERLTQAGASTTDQGASGQAGTSATQSQPGATGQTASGSGQGGSASGQSSAGAVPGQTGGGTTNAQAVLVSVDSANCVGCGRCLAVCPAGVFGWDSSGQRATAAYPDRCTRCHRCMQACPASAITVNG